tara:strand:- start:3788 stop:4780 length:993 start_codon:yes stop_codon:yes gene_type:complete
MPSYDLAFILEFSKTIVDKKLNVDVENYLNNILFDIKKPVYNIAPNFNTFNSYKNRSKNNKNNKNYRRNSHKEDYSFERNFSKQMTLDKDTITSTRINRIKDINNKSEYDLIITNIRKILNKITIQTYDKLKNEFLCYYKSIYDTKTPKELNKVNIFIYESLIYNNIIFNSLYSDLLFNLININSEFSDIMNNYLEIFYNINKYIKIPESNLYEQVSEINKHNDKYKCLCGFYISCYKITLIPNQIIFDVISNLHQELFINIKLENKKDYNELITQFIFLIISNINLSNENEVIINNCNYISNLKSNTFPSITNRIIFKHKDIVEKYIKK